MLLARLRAAAWSGAEGESEGGGGWCPVTTPRSGPERPKRQRGMDAGGVQSPRGKPVPLLRTASLQSFALLPLQDSAWKLFDEMPARSKDSKFQNFQIGLVIILDRDSKTIFVRSRGGVLLQGYFEFGNVLYFRFKLWTIFKCG
jgi:hypothetical protein